MIKIYTLSRTMPHLEIPRRLPSSDEEGGAPSSAGWLILPATDRIGGALGEVRGFFRPPRAPPKLGGKKGTEIGSQRRQAGADLEGLR